MAAKKSMRAAFINEFGGIDKIKFGEFPLPEPLDNEVQIAVECAGVNPADWKVCDGLFRNRLPHEFPIIPGWDVSGKISKVGAGVQNLKVGEAVFAYCRKPVVHEGAFAEYICLDAENVSLKPAGISFAEAASIPLASLTAWQSLFDSAHLRPKEHILIHGGAGGVGGFAIQFAKYAGAHVTTTASGRNFDYVKKLGADEIIDYTKEDFVKKVHEIDPDGVDVVFDTIGGETLKASYNAAKTGGRLVSIVGIVDKALVAQKKLFSDLLFVTPNGKELKRIATLIEEGELLPPKIQLFPFDQLLTALHLSKEGHIQGKIIINIRGKAT